MHPLFPFPEPGVIYHLRGGRHELIYAVDDPSPEEIRGMREGTSHFALVEQNGIIFLLSTFETPDHQGFPWSDAPYNTHLNPPDQRQLPVPTDYQMTPQSRLLLPITLADFSTGTIHVLRQVSLSHEFTTALLDALVRQASGPPLPDYRTQLSRVYSLFPTTKSMLGLARVNCRGGA